MKELETLERNERTLETQKKNLILQLEYII